jgi:GNAT superfamily N-acetyltransferase
MTQAGESGLTIRELPIPASMEAEGASDFAVAMDVHFSCEALAYGTAELRFTPAESLPSYLDQEHEPVRLFVATVKGRIVGLARYQSEPKDDGDTVWLMIDVLPEFRERGIGTALSSRMQTVANTDHIRKSIVYAVAVEEAGERIPAPTGFGSVAAASAESRFLLARGYRLEQIERGSRLALPLSLAGRLAAARAAAGIDYFVHQWCDRTPTRWVDDMAMLHTRMSTEEPTAGLEEPEDLWTVGRLLAEEGRRATDPRTRFVTAIEHAPTKRLAAFTSLSAPVELERAAAQEDTLVLPEHRGHRLGMLLKVANLDYLQREKPGHPSIVTFNAEENRHMLDVNEAVGFIPIGYEGAWRKDLPA